MDIWKTLYDRARSVQNPRAISPFIEAGSVGAAILTKAGNIYVGVCIDTACTLGMCAERNAIANMITKRRESDRKGRGSYGGWECGSACGACREFMMQLDQDSANIEILMDFDTRRTVTLGELTPHWWGQDRFDSLKP